jgi:hypothetical protein
VSSSSVMLVLIGDKWLTTTDARGRQRLDNPDDYVRLELEAALAREMRVIPVLVEGAAMPGTQELPDSVAGLARRNALEVSHGRFSADAERLINVIERIFSATRDSKFAGALHVDDKPVNADQLSGDLGTTSRSSTTRSMGGVLRGSSGPPHCKGTSAPPAALASPSRPPLTCGSMYRECPVLTAGYRSSAAPARPSRQRRPCGFSRVGLVQVRSG